MYVKTMKILLLGEYSNVHATLADGLRSLGHKVVVASNGDFWKSYPRDIDLSRDYGFAGGLRLWAKIMLHLKQFSGFDIVQIINPMFLELKAERHFFIFDYLRKHNRKVVMGAFGMDYYWVHENITRLPLRYSDFNIGKELRNDKDATVAIKDWTGTAKERLNRYCAEKADAIVAGLYEYDVCYRGVFPDKTVFIPMPIKPTALSESRLEAIKRKVDKVKIFVGISKNRSEYKGTDIMLDAAKHIADKYKECVELRIVEGVPFEEYRQLMADSDVILDQLYSYTPAMNALEAMSQGLVCVGGGEPENYDILGETELRPIVNVEPDFQSVYNALEHLVKHREDIPEMKLQGIKYIARHHDYITVARKYAQLYSKILCNP
jgi:glycosyltransferase involved in cell wall biosynthesis